MSHLFDVQIDKNQSPKNSQSQENPSSYWNQIVPILWKANHQGEIIYLSQEWQQYTGQVPQQSLGNKFFKVVHQEDGDRLLEQWQQARSQQQRFVTNLRLLNRRGDYRQFTWRSEPVQGDNDQIVEWIGTCTPDEEENFQYQQLQEALRKCEERWQLTLEGTGEAIFDWNIHKNEVFYSPQFQALLGAQEEEIAHTWQEWRHRLHPDDVEQVLETLQAYLDQKIPRYEVEYRLLCQDGSYKWILSRGQAQWDEQNQPVRMVGSNLDISARKKAEAEIIQLNQQLEKRVQRRTAQLEAVNRHKDQLLTREREVRTQIEAAQVEIGLYRDIVDNMQLGLCVWRLENWDELGSFRLVAINPAAAQMLKISPANDIGKGIGECFPGSSTSNQADLEAYVEVVRSGQAKDLGAIYHSDARVGVAVYEVKAFPLPDQCVGVAFNNVTDRIKTETALAASEQKYRTVVNNVKEIIFQTDRAGCWTFLNPAWREITGFAVPESLNKPFTDYIYAEEDQQYCAGLFQTLMDGKQAYYQYEFRLLTKNGNFRWLEIEAQVNRDTNGKILGTSGTINDTTERKQTEAVLQARADELTQINSILLATTTQLERRNRELDQFAYVTSHDLKAPLRAIANLSEWIEEDLEGKLDQDTQHQMNLLRGRVHRMEALINGLLQYSRVGRIEGETKLVDVNQLLAEVIDSLAPPPEFTIIIQEEMPVFQTKPLLLQQVFTNLISNAIKHHNRPDGQVTISVSEHGNFYQFAVADDGVGIAPEYYEKVFVIFQTLEARDKSENTGIGLSIVKKIVESGGGKIWLESQLGQGTTFYFTWSK